MYDRRAKARLSTPVAFVKQLEGGNSKSIKKSNVKQKKLGRSLLEMYLGTTLMFYGAMGASARLRVATYVYAAAPNKKLRALLNRHLTNPIVLANEYGSSKTSCCCHGPVKPLKEAGQLSLM